MSRSIARICRSCSACARSFEQAAAFGASVALLNVWRSVDRAVARARANFLEAILGSHEGRTIK
jgi:hypothetical protein